MHNHAQDTDDAILALLAMNENGLTYVRLRNRIPHTAIDGRLFSLLTEGKIHCTNKVFWVSRAKRLTIVR